MKTLYEHAWVLTMDEEMHTYRDGCLLTDGAGIAAVGEGPFTGACDARVDLHGASCSRALSTRTATPP